MNDTDFACRKIIMKQAIEKLFFIQLHERALQTFEKPKKVFIRRRKRAIVRAYRSCSWQQRTHCAHNNVMVCTCVGVRVTATICSRQQRLCLPRGAVCYLAPEVLRALRPTRYMTVSAVFPFNEHTDVFAFGYVSQSVRLFNLTKIDF